MQKNKKCWRTTVFYVQQKLIGSWTTNVNQLQLNYCSVALEVHSKNKMISPQQQSLTLKCFPWRSHEVVGAHPLWTEISNIYRHVNHTEIRMDFHNMYIYNVCVCVCHHLFSKASARLIYQSKEKRKARGDVAGGQWISLHPLPNEDSGLRLWNDSGTPESRTCKFFQAFLKC